VDDLKDIALSSLDVHNRACAGSIIHREFDISRLKKGLGDFHFTDFKEGLRITFDRFVQNK